MAKFTNTYTQRLAERHKAKRLMAQAAKVADPDVRPVPQAAAIDPALAEKIGFVHPHRYPKHADPAKGQVFDGECNTTRCEHRRARFFNRGTYGLYCVHCGRGQNANDPVPISVVVDAKPSGEQMDAMHREMMDDMRALNDERRRLSEAG